MTPENFCYWLQGASEVFPSKRPSENEWLVIQDHLKLVFKKETPDRQPLTEVPKHPFQLDLFKDGIPAAGDYRGDTQFFC